MSHTDYADNTDFIFKEHESCEYTECGLYLKRETQASEPKGLIRVIRIIRVRKNSSCLWFKQQSPKGSNPKNLWYSCAT